MGGGGGGQKFLLNRLQAVGTHGAGNTASGPMVTQPIPDLQASVRTLVCLLLARPPAAAPKWADWGSNRQTDTHSLGFLSVADAAPSSREALRRHPRSGRVVTQPTGICVGDCLLAGSETDWLTVNLSSRCTAEGNRISTSSSKNIQTHCCM